MQLIENAMKVSPWWCRSHAAVPAVLLIDSDEDGLPDDVERRIGTDPFNKDTDGDGFDEIALGYTVTRSPDWDNDFGAVGAVLKDGPGLLAGSDPREEGTAAGK